MIYVLISIKDRATEAFQPVASVRAKGEAIRSFQDAINNPQNPQLNNHPDDYDLYIVGYFDDQTGEITNLDKPEKLADGKQLRILNT
jgi:hypothetical protein